MSEVFVNTQAPYQVFRLLYLDYREYFLFPNRAVVKYFLAYFLNGHLLLRHSVCAQVNVSE